MDCGCKIDHNATEQAESRAVIIFCPLHEAAEKMRDCLDNIAEDLRSGWLENPSKRTEQNCEHHLATIRTLLAKIKDG